MWWAAAPGLGLKDYKLPLGILASVLSSAVSLRFTTEPGSGSVRTRFGVHVLRDQGLAEEMVQETFIRFCQRAGS